MAFFRKAGSIFLRSVSNHISSRGVTISKPSIFQTIRWMSSSRVFVGGISYSTDNSSLEEAFRKYGEVTEARVIVDRETGRSRGFGFVTFTSAEEASAAIQALDQQDLHGRQIRVAYANDRQRGFGGGGGTGGYNRGYGGGGGYGSDYGGNYGGGGGGYGGNYNSGGGGGYNNNNGDGGLNYNSGVGSYGSAGGTNDGYDGQNFGATGGNDYFGSGGGSSAGGRYDGFGDGLDKNSGGDSFGDNEGNNLVDGDDVDNYADRRN